MFYIENLKVYAILETEHEIKVHILHMRKIIFQHNRQVLSLARGLDLACSHIYTHLLHTRAVKALTRLSACAAASKHLHLVDIAISTKMFMS